WPAGRLEQPRPAAPESPLPAARTALARASSPRAVAADAVRAREWSGAERLRCPGADRTMAAGARMRRAREVARGRRVSRRACLGMRTSRGVVAVAAGEALPAIESALYVVATPLGNLRDVTLRALDVLGRVDLVAAEDTRVTHALLAHHRIAARTLSLHEHNEPARAGKVLDLLAPAGT